MSLDSPAESPTPSEVAPDEAPDELTSRAGTDRDAATKPSAGFYVAAGIAGALLALAVVLLLLLVNERDEADKLRTEQRDQVAALQTAAQLVEALVNFGPEGADARRTTVEELATGPILNQYDGALTAFSQAAGAVGIQSVQSRVHDTYLGQIADDQAQVVVVFDVRVLGTSPRSIPNQYMRVHLARIGGGWKVDNVESVNIALAALASGGDQGTTTSTTTTPP